MQLRSSPTSPFGRKVKLAAAITGVLKDIRVETTNTLDPSDSIRQQNPLGKIPTLVLDDGSVLYDSRVIIEYLDTFAPGRLLPASGKARFETLRRQALADGLMDAGILRIYEIRFRDEAIRSQKWDEHQRGKVERALAAMEAEAGLPRSPPDAGDIATACALGYLDFRFKGEWRAGHPRLVAFLDAFAKAVPVWADTAPKD